MPVTPIEVGSTVAILIRLYEFYSLNSARIVYILDETGEIELYGFAYGTLTEHAEIGEERFTVELNRSTNDVWYDLFSFSKPGHPLARIFYPFARSLQKQFATESKIAMLRAVNSKSLET